jgi:RNA polymerase sigma-B factor
VPVQREDEQQRFVAARAGNAAARDDLVTKYMPLARHLARRYKRSSEPLEDLEQVACLALIKAVDGFDPDRLNAFSTYAVPCIAGALKRHFRDHGWAVRVPRDLQELALRIQRLDDDCFADTGRHATASELAAAANLDVESVLEAREAHRALYSDSLDQPRSVDGEDSSIIDTLGENDPALASVVDTVALDSVLASLEERERTILELYYREELTQAEIGQRLGYSQMHISRLIRTAIAQLEATTAAAA